MHERYRGGVRFGAVQHCGIIRGDFFPALRGFAEIDALRHILHVPVCRICAWLRYGGYVDVKNGRPACGQICRTVRRIHPLRVRHINGDIDQKEKQKQKSRLFKHVKKYMPKADFVCRFVVLCRLHTASPYPLCEKTVKMYLTADILKSQ